MKIVHVCTTSAFSKIYAYQENLLAYYHRKLGNEVTIIAPVYDSVDLCNKEPVGEEWLEDGTKVLRLPSLINSRLFYEHFQLVKGLKQAILNESPDLLFVHAVGCFSYLCLREIKKTNPTIRIVFDNHADYVNSLHSPITRFLHKVVYRYTLVPSLVRVAEWFYGVTPSRCDFLMDVYGVPKKKIKLLVMGADDDKMMIDKRDEFRLAIRNRYGIKEDDFLIVTGGKIDIKKNIHVLAEAINQSQYLQIKLLIFGTISPELESIFKQIESNRIQYIGWIRSSDVYQYFYASDLVVFPGLHSVLWEQAVACKVPCAFTHINGFEHIDVGGNCILMDGSGVDYYKNLMEQLFLDKESYLSLLNNAHSNKTDQFSYSRIAKSVIDDITEI